MRRVGVFCSSRSEVRPAFIAAAQHLGGEIGRRGAEMVYGGSRLGLMGIAAQAVHAAGGRTVGVVPQALLDRGLNAPDDDLTFYCAALDDRKATMLREADIFVALPGGIGTLDEVFTVVAAATLGLHEKRVVLYDVEGFWQPALAMLRSMQAEGMIGEGLENRLAVAKTEQELYAMIF